VEVLGGGRGVGDLDVVFAGGLEVALEAGARVFGALAFEAVGRGCSKWVARLLGCADR